MASRLAEPSKQTMEKDQLAWVYTWLDLRKPPKRFSGGAGMASTAGDVGRLLQMLANGGEIDGVRLLSPKTVRYMLHVDHLDGLGRVDGFDDDEAKSECDEGCKVLGRFLAAERKALEA